MLLLKYRLSLKLMAREHRACHVSKSDTGYTHLKQQYEKNAEIIFASPSRFSAEEKKEKKTNNKLMTTQTFAS